MTISDIYRSIANSFLFFFSAQCLATGALPPPAAPQPPPLLPSGVEEQAEKSPPNGTSIIYSVPIPGSAGDSVKLREVIDGSGELLQPRADEE